MKKLNNNKVISIIFLIVIGIFTITTLGNLGFRVSRKVMDKIMTSDANNITYINTAANKINTDVKGVEEVTSVKEDEELSLNMKIKKLISKVENSYNSHVFFREGFVEIYGSMQKLLNKRVQDDYVKDNYDIIQKPTIERDVTSSVDSINDFSKFISDNGINFLYVQPPSKVIEDFTSLPQGIEDKSNMNIDSFLNGLSNVNYIDLRKNFKNDDIKKEKLFYKTDHHWRIETAFQAYSFVIDKLNKLYNMNLDDDGLLTDKNNFDENIYEKNFLGSQGNKLSKSYSGLDDFTLITPNFETNIKLTQILNDQILHERSGSFKDALIYDELIKEKEKGYSIESYTSYLGYGNTEKIILNSNADNDKKVLVIGDSFSRPFSAFMSLCFRETRNIDTQPGRFDKDIYNYILEYQPDLVIVLFDEWALGSKDTFNFKRIELQ